jgi:DNA-binding NtrC family response regulator
MVSIQEGVIKNTHLLLVDDEENIRLSLSLIARKAGYRVSTASDGEDALQKIVEFEHGPDCVDVLVIDIQMPGLTGLDLYSELQRQNLGIPVIIMSGYHYREAIAGLHVRGTITYLEKPFQPDEFLKNVADAIKSSERSSQDGTPVRRR